MNLGIYLSKNIALINLISSFYTHGVSSTSPSSPRRTQNAKLQQTPSSRQLFLPPTVSFWVFLFKEVEVEIHRGSDKIK